MTEKKHTEFCAIHGLVMKIMWVMLGVAVSYAGTSIGFAWDVHTTVTKLAVVSASTVKDVEAVKAKYESIDDKMDTLIAYAKRGKK